MKNIEQYKTKLDALHAEMSKRITAIEKDLHHEEIAVEKDFAEQATQRENDDVLNSLDEEAKSTLILVNNALGRIEDGSYGQCLECGEQINEARLDAVPFAEFCIDCAE